MIRRTVPNDNSCLFYAIAYCCEGVDASRSVEQRLRGVVRDAVLADPDPDTRSLFLGRPVAEYAQWIMNSHHWGGESEIVVLSDYYKVEIAVVSCEMMSTMVYGEGAAKGRIYVLYTGSHYDPLVAVSAPDCMPSNEMKMQASGSNAALDAAALVIARDHVVEAARKAAQKKVKKIKCMGCGALLDTKEAFQEHCMDDTVAHDDDFAYECDEVEVVYDEGDALPEGVIDLTNEEKVCTFYNSVDYVFSSIYPAAVEIDGLTYATAEHAWHSLKYTQTAPELARKIQKTDTVEAALVLSHTEGMDKIRDDWDTIKYDMLLKVHRAKFHQHKELQEKLLATGERLLVYVDADTWAGMSAPGGIATGANNVGKALMEVRQQLRP